MISPNSLASLQKLVDQNARFLVVSHVRPDGDAYGSTLGLALALRALGKDVRVHNEDGLSPLFTFLPGADGLRDHPTAPEADRLIIAVDCADQRRLGKTFDSWQRLPDVNIDHHVSNPGYARLNFIDADSPATAQVLCEIIAELKWPLTADIAANLYVGLMTDTGSFRYRQTTARTFEIAAKLVAAGADPTDLAEACYQSFRAERLLLVKEVLGGISFTGDKRIAWFTLTPEMYEGSGAIPEESEGLIEHLQAVKTVECAFLLEALPDGLTRASLRSRGTVDVQKICQEFGGGGHRLAAGLRTKLPPAELEKKLIEKIEQQLSA
ncbi:MAG TPA: bifunctional oligoribonuclease/PAP phosphatase NrnA [Candidatus Methylacidiphilales bacterium]|jgi:phosphoesterase RecJ-like protein|nr:bifunctional oligoribonuclease/PAP phosphatase NrnA [Candidatus Methylacidiphilales bacterium]